MKQTVGQSTIPVFVGVDTHKDKHEYAIVDPNGQILGMEAFPATGVGYAAAVTWTETYGHVLAWGVESIGSYGAGLAQVLKTRGAEVHPVKYPVALLKGTTGKTDEHDAVSAARAVAFDYSMLLGVRKTPMEEVTVLAWLLVERDHYVQTGKDGTIRLKSLLVTAPSEIRDSLHGLKTQAMLNKISTWRPTDSFKRCARNLAKDTKEAYHKADEVEDQIQKLVRELCPSLLDITGIGSVGAAVILVAVGWAGPEHVPSEPQLAAYSGTAPIPASSGKTDKHRLNRGGNRQLNAVLHRAVLIQKRLDPKVQAWFEAKASQGGKTKKDLIRCSKRYLVRTVRKALLNPFGEPENGYLTS